MASSSAETSSAVGQKATTRRSLRWFNFNAFARSVYDTVCGGSTFLFVAYALSLGVHENAIGRFTLVASVACLFQMLALPLLRRVSDRKRFILRVGSIEPTVMIAAILVTPLLPIDLRQMMLLVAVFAAAAFAHLTRPIQDDWLASVVPAGLRGRYLSRRTQVMAVVLIATTVFVGQVGDWVGIDNSLGLAVVLCVAGVFGLVSLWALNRAEMAAVEPNATPLTLRNMTTVFAVVPYRRHIIGNLLYWLPFLLAVPFYQAHFQRGLGMSLLAVSLLPVIYQLTKIAICAKAGPLVDRFGARVCATAMMPLYAIFFAMLGLATPGTTWLIFAAWGIVGAADGLWGVAAQASLYAAVPKKHPFRPAFFAFSNLLTIGLFGVGALVAEGLVRFFQANPPVIADYTLGRYQALYWLCALLMVPTGFGAMLFAARRRQQREV